jgi:hypothetical protein
MLLLLLKFAVCVVLLCAGAGTIMTKVTTSATKAFI